MSEELPPSINILSMSTSETVAVSTRASSWGVDTRARLVLSKLMGGVSLVAACFRFPSAVLVPSAAEYTSREALVSPPEANPPEIIYAVRRA